MCRDDFEQVKSIARCVGKDWRELLADCFPKIMVNILPYFALSSQDARVAQQQETAHRVYNLLKDSSCLGKQVSCSADPALCASFLLLATAKRRQQTCSFANQKKANWARQDG